MENKIRDLEPYRYSYDLNGNAEPQSFSETPIEESPAYVPNPNEPSDLISTSPAYVPVSDAEESHGTPEEWKFAKRSMDSESEESYGTPEEWKFAKNSGSQNGGTINLFPHNSQMNSVFNMLSGDKQATLLQMPEEQREIVMKQIMLKSGRISTDNGNSAYGNSAYGIDSQKKGNVLEPYFNALPIDKQLNALKGGYNSMSKEFNVLAEKVEKPLFTIKKPMSMQEELTNQWPLLKVEDNNKSSDNTSDSTSSSSSSSSSSDSNSSSSSSDSSSSNSIKKITI
jgi:hypothetical protein